MRVRRQGPNTVWITILIVVTVAIGYGFTVAMNNKPENVQILQGRNEPDGDSRYTEAMKANKKHEAYIKRQDDEMHPELRWRRLRIGMTPSEVVNLIGRPSLTRENLWIYFDSGTNIQEAGKIQFDDLTNVVYMIILPATK